MRASTIRIWLLTAATAFGVSEVVAFCPRSMPVAAPFLRGRDGTIVRERTRILSQSVTDDGEEAATLPWLFPGLSTPLTALGYSAPTPIQSASASRALTGENLILIAPTGSGKTLGYLLPALTRAIQDQGTILMVAPTRELAVQLMRDATSIISNLGEEDDDVPVALAVKGVELPTEEQLEISNVLIGTPPELLQTLTSVRGAQEFIAGDVLSTVILDEVDVLLPNAPKALRTSLDEGDGKKNSKKKNENNPQDERRRQEQRRKLMALKRKGTEISTSKQVVAPTEKLLQMIASRRFAGAQAATPYQVLAGSATASRRTLDRLKKAMRGAAIEAASSYEAVWGGDLKACRPVEVDAAEGDAASPHTIRAVTVPQQVEHRYVVLDKSSASSPDAALSAVAKAAALMKPQTALVFLCGEFGRSNVKEKSATKVVPKGATASARRNSMRKKMQIGKSKGKSGSTEETTLSARKACSTLGTFGIEAQPLHVALGLELNAKEDTGDETPPFLVTFEGSARGLHFDAVDAVFIVGRPASAASYLHLAGRVGRSGIAANDGDGSVVIRPGTVVSLCTRGSAGELEKWTRQIGGTELEELVI